MVEELIPIVMFVVIGVVFGLFAYFKFRTRAETQRLNKNKNETAKE